jgi:hypothetical protein
MVADYNPQIVGPINFKDKDGDFDVENEKKDDNKDNRTPLEKKVDRLEKKIDTIEDILEIEPGFPEAIEITKQELDLTPLEDKIGDEAHGGDPSVSDIVDTKVDVSTDKEVFPTNSEYVARITKRLDRVANILEKRGLKRMAFRVDQLSDKLESSIRK